MNPEIYSRIRQQLYEKKSKFVYFDNPNYIGKEISVNNFRTIPVEKKRKLCFIDGGNIEIIGNKSFSLQLLRIYWCVYENNKRINSKKTDYYVFVYISDGIYISEIYHDKNIVEKLNFNLNINNKRIKPERIINSIRRIYELKTISECSDKIHDSIIIIDGNLSVKNQQEYNVIENAYKKIKEKNNILAGLCKTTSIITDSGVNVVGYLNSISPEKEKWIYFPICENNNLMHKAEIVCVKLNENSKYAFLLDIFKEQKEFISHVCFNLSQNSKEPAFFGYPYGLIEADRMARCQEQEKELLKTRFMQMINLGEKSESIKISKIIDTDNAHNILDNMN